jgi:hypothetical protein
VALLGIAAGVGGAVAWSALQSGDGPGPATPAAAANVTPIDEAALDAPRTPSIAASPEDAVAGFLTAERDGDLETSFTFLSATDRAALASEAGWVAAHADLMPPVRGFDIGAVVVAADGRTATVQTDVELEASLDEFSGLVPGRAAISWTAVEDGGGWGVDLERRVIEPVLPPEGEAADVVRRWGESRQRCAADHQWAGEPLAFPALAEGLCGASGDVEVGEAEELAATDATSFVAAFGGDVLTSLRVVPMSTPAPLRAVVAPIGSEWVVVGVLPA